MPQGEVEAIYTIAFDIHDDVVEREALHDARTSARPLHRTHPVPADLRRPRLPCCASSTGPTSQAVGAARRRAARPTYRRGPRCGALGAAPALLRACTGGGVDAVHAPGRKPAAGSTLAAHQLRARFRRRRPGAGRLHRDDRRARPDRGAAASATQCRTRRADRRAEPAHDDGAPRRRRGRCAVRSRWRCSSSTSTASSRSTMRRATPRATPCWSHWPRRCSRRCGPKTPSVASVATSSWCWPPCATRPAPMRWPTTCCRRCTTARPAAAVRSGVSASIGYALAPHDATQPLRLLQLADNAMYAAKRLRQGPRDALRRGMSGGQARQRYSNSPSVRRSMPVRARNTLRGRARLEQQCIDQLRAPACLPGRPAAPGADRPPRRAAPPSPSRCSDSTIGSICNGSVASTAASASGARPRRGPARARASAPITASASVNRCPGVAGGA